MTWEYPYHNWQAQENLADRLIPASLYGMNVVRPGYCSADARPVPATEAQAAYDSGRGCLTYISDTDVNAHATPVGEAGPQLLQLFLQLSPLRPDTIHVSLEPVVHNFPFPGDLSHLGGFGCWGRGGRRGLGTQAGQLLLELVLLPLQLGHFIMQAEGCHQIGCLTPDEILSFLGEGTNL